MALTSTVQCAVRGEGDYGYVRPGSAPSWLVAAAIGLEDENEERRVKRAHRQRQRHCALNLSANATVHSTSAKVHGTPLHTPPCALVRVRLHLMASATSTSTLILLSTSARTHTHTHTHARTSHLNLNFRTQPQSQKHSRTSLLLLLL